VADEAIGEAAAATAAEGGAVLLIPNPEAEAAEHLNGAAPAIPPWAGMVEAHEARLVTLEQRIESCEATHTMMFDGLEGRALSAHEHPVDEDVRILADELRALRSEEVAPRRGRLPQRGWLRRWLRGEHA
jgi:hypothetical protein